MFAYEQRGLQSAQRLNNKCVEAIRPRVSQLEANQKCLPPAEALKHLLHTQQLPAPQRSAAGFCGSVTAEKRSKISEREGRTEL